MADNPITDENNVVLYDDLGNKVGVILKNGIYRLENRGVITSPDGADDVDVLDDSGTKRLAVDAKISVGGSSDPVDAVFDGTPGSNPTTLSTHTVNTGKVFQIFGWSISSDGAEFECELQIAGIMRDKMYQSDSSQTSRGLNQAEYSVGIFEATAGQVVRIQRIGGATGKGITSLLWGIEIDA